MSTKSGSTTELLESVMHIAQPWSDWLNRMRFTAWIFSYCGHAIGTRRAATEGAPICSLCAERAGWTKDHRIKE